jgi:predicted hydrolase (HD superfamily)
MAVSKEIVDAVLNHAYTQEDWLKGGPTTTEYRVANDYANTREGFLSVATIIEAYERVKVGDTTAVDVSAIAKEFKL